MDISLETVVKVLAILEPYNAVRFECDDMNKLFPEPRRESLWDFCLANQVRCYYAKSIFPWKFVKQPPGEMLGQIMAQMDRKG